MDLHTGRPYWLELGEFGSRAPALEHDRRCDVAIIGAGITGALAAVALTRAGLDVVVVDRREVGHGSTAASTALLQYDLDVPLHELSEKIGIERARDAFRAGAGAIDSLVELGASVGCPVERVPSIYALFDDRKGDELRSELDARLEAGLRVEWLTAEAALREWGVRLRAGILSSQAAQVDPYALTRCCLREVIDRGGTVAAGTKVLEVTAHASGVSLRTEQGVSIEAEWVVHATGYEAACYLPVGAVDLASTYVFASAPMERSRAPFLLWEYANPYIYLRWAGDRLLVGGGDEPTSDDRERDAMIDRKARELQRRVRAILPRTDPSIEFAWAGTFASTPDGLGYIGPIPGRDREMVALGFGGNGITMSALAAEILRDRLTGVPNPLEPLFGFGRRQTGTDPASSLGRERRARQVTPA